MRKSDVLRLLGLFALGLSLGCDASSGPGGAADGDDDEPTIVNPDLPPEQIEPDGSLACSAIDEANWYNAFCFVAGEEPLECQRVDVDGQDCSVWCGCEAADQTCDLNNTCQTHREAVVATCQTCSLYLKLNADGARYDDAGKLTHVSLDVWYNPVARELGNAAEPQAGIVDVRIRASREVSLVSASVIEPSDREQAALAAGAPTDGIINLHKKLMVDPKTGRRWKRIENAGVPPEFRFLLHGVDNATLVEPGVLLTLNFEVRDPRATAFWLPTRLYMLAPREADEALQADTEATGYHYSTQAVFLNEL